MQIPRRIGIIGTSGSGKSTLARRLSSVLDVPYFELDNLYWEPNWTCASAEVFRERVSAVVQQELAQMAEQGTKVVVHTNTGETEEWVGDIHSSIQALHSHL